MSFAERFDAVMFDMDGLLFDTERLFHQAMQAAGREVGREVPLPLFLSLVGHPKEHNFVLLRQHFGDRFEAEAFHSLCHDHMNSLLKDGLQLKPGVIELLDQLNEEGVPLALVTSSSRCSVDRNLAQFDLSRRFQQIVAHGDYRYGKPDPEPYLTAAEQLAVKPARCFALEDSFNGVRSAAGAGMQTVMVPDMLEPTDEMRRLCMAIMPDLHAVRLSLRGPTDIPLEMTSPA